jgi:general secretion pathway protein C
MSLTLSKAPTDYTVPQKREKKIDISQLENLMASHFPQEKSKKEKTSNRQTNNIKPPPVEVLGIARGTPSGAILKVKGKTLTLLQGEEKEGIKLLQVGEDFILIEFKGVKFKIPLKGKKYFYPTAQGKSSEKGEKLLRVSKSLVERLVQNYGDLLKQVDFVPHFRDGKIEGFKIRWISQSSPLYKLGFRKGDVILSVNGISLRNTDDLFRVLQVIANEPSLRIEVLRNGKREIFNVKID